jgi:hypothetical protein
MNLLQIMEGWRNHLVPAEELKDIIDVTMKERKKICLQCPFHSSNMNTIRPDDHCTLCGCPDISKLKCLSCVCADEDAPKWGEVDALTLEQQEYELKELEENGTE